MSSFLDTQRKLEVGNKEVGVSWTGQAGFAFKDSKGLIYYVDPYLSNICLQSVGFNRVVPAPVEAKKVIADYIFITHAHRDHLDDASLPAILNANPELVFVAPPSCISRLLELNFPAEQLITIQRDQEKKLGNVILKAVIAHHTDDSVGYVLHFDDVTFYITGDTTYSDDLIKIKEDTPDVMMACINGRLGCLNIPDAARLSGHIQPKFAVPMHHGMFKENTADPNEFIRLVEAYSGITNGMLMKFGKWYVYKKQQGFVLNN